MTRLSCWFVLLFLGHVGSAYGQGGSPPSVVIDGTVGSATFVDEAMVHHLLIGASPRVYVTNRLSIGPEVVFMRGPGFDRDLLVTGNVTYDLAPVGSGPWRRVTPFLLAGGGLLRHQNRVGTTAFRAESGVVTGGGGLRVSLSDRVSVGVDARLIQWPHYRIAASAAIRVRGR